MQHGKDTFAQFLKEEMEAQNRRVLITHFADNIKSICKNMFNWNGEKDEYGRHLLQYVGTDFYRNKIDQDYWVNRMIDNLAAVYYCPFVTYDTVIIPDTRFPNEIQHIEQLSHSQFGDFLTKITTIRIERDNLEENSNSNHISEMALDDYEFDIIISNNGTLEDLKLMANKVSNILKDRK